MKKIMPNNNEKFLQDGEMIISKTDKNGKILYCNRIFMSLAGYTESELLGKPHNIVRHPDMPKIIFELFWERILKGKEIVAYVKNLSKDGSFYWVLAFVTPSFNSDGEIVGFYSMRLKPKREAIDKIWQIYQELLIAEQGGGKKASREKLMNFLEERGMSYDEYVLSL